MVSDFKRETQGWIEVLSLFCTDSKFEGVEKVQIAHETAFRGVVFSRLLFTAFIWIKYQFIGVCRPSRVTIETYPSTHRDSNDRKEVRPFHHPRGKCELST